MGKIIKSRTLFFIILILAFCSISVFAQDTKSQNKQPEVISLLVGQIRVLEVDTPSRVSVANPKIADISSISEKEIVLGGKSAGNTTLTIWDKKGERSFIVRVFSEDLQRLSQDIEQLLTDLEIQGLSVQVNEPQGKVILMGKIQEEQKELFEKALQPYKGKIADLVSIEERKPLVLIDIEILEIAKSDIDKLGISWSDYMQFREEPYSGSSTTGITTTLDKTGTLSELVRIADWSRDALDFKLNFLKTEDRARTLSRPKLVCVSGKSADFLVGGEIPIIQTTTTQTTTAAGVVFKKYGIKLSIEPVVRRDGNIDVKLSTEISDVDWGHTVTTTYGTTPSFTNRSASTELRIKEGQTIFLAGLLKNKDSKNMDKVPGLADIPILGTLFKSKQFQLDQTELVISLTPAILKEAQQLPRAGPQQPPVSKTEKQMPVLEEEQMLYLPEEEKEAKMPLEVIAPEKIPEIQEEPQAITEEPTQAVYGEPFVEYVSSVQRRISQAAVYPAIAQESGWGGSVGLRLHISKDGQLDQILLNQSSGFSVLDEAALNLVKAQAPYPKFPAQITNEALWLDITIAYQSD